MTKRILKIASSSVIYIIAILTAILIVLSLCGIKPYITTSGSMEPNIKTGSICFVNTNANYDDVKIDDVIAFRAGNTLVTHRALNFVENGIQTKGDNNEDPDKLITDRSNFVGRTLFSIPHIGYAIMFVKQPICLAIIAAILLLLMLLNTKDVLKENSQKTNNKVQMTGQLTTSD